MEHPDRYHQLFSANLRARAKRAVGRLVFGKIDISPNEVNSPERPLETRLAQDVEQLRWEAQVEAWDEGNN